MRLPPVAIRTEFLPFAGGLDVVTPPLAIPAGMCRNAQNFELNLNGGYRRIPGTERSDGRPAPSDASYAVLATILTASVSAGDILTSSDGTAVGTVIAVTDTETILTKVEGAFSAGNVTVGGSVVGTCSGAQRVDAARTPLLQAQYKNLAADVYRADIQAVPGTGDVLGVHVFDDTVYAWRNNASDTAVDMYRQTPAGWQPVELGWELAFTAGGLVEVQENDTLTGATSGATAVVLRVVLESGAWDAGTAAGRFILAAQSGTFLAEAVHVGIDAVASVAGNSSAIAFAVPGGRFACINHNFGGGAGTTRMYGVDGKNRAFEFDGAVFVPIATGMTLDAPSHLCAHKNQLFLSFAGSVQHSGIGQPYSWQAVTGAAELAMGETVTGFAPQPGSESGGALAIFTRNSIALLYGSSVADWNLVAYSQEAGAIPHTIAHIGQTLLFDDRGITSLAASQAFGNFSDATLSARVQTWLQQRRGRATGACIARDRNQYRLFFADGSALYATMQNKKLLGCMPMLFPHPVTCVVSAELSDGSEVTYAGSTDGYVYQLDKGTSFDGQPIEAFLELAFAHLGSPRIEKRFRKATFEVAGEGYAEFDFSYDLGYGSTEIAQPGQTTLATDFTPAYWDAFTWDAFIWDGRNLSPSECDMTGAAENVSLRIRAMADYFAPITFSGALLDVTPRRRKR